jgi:Glycosyl transferases group 1
MGATAVEAHCATSNSGFHFEPHSERLTMRNSVANAGDYSTRTSEGYAVFLICDEIDQFGHNAVFAHEIGAALAECGFASHIIDYRREIRRVQDALADADCAFFICFNGFGCELALPWQAPGELVSAFGHYRKLLFDLTHDCPSHESAAHQTGILDVARHVLLTDYGYVQEAQELGIRNVRYAPSITFPKSLPPVLRTEAHRPIQALLPLQLPPPSSADVRLDRGGSYRQRTFREIYEAVTVFCVADLGADPRVETRRACREAGIGFDVRDPDHRFLLTVIFDHTKFSRRRDLINALRGLPVTIVSNTDVETNLLNGFSTAPARSFRDLLTLMTKAACVICPLPHMTGFHERALGAFTAGASVFAAPNDVLETHFQHGRDMLVYRSAAELAEILPSLLAEPDRLSEIGRSGQNVALDLFAPKRLAETMLSSWRLNYTVAMAPQRGDRREVG